MPLYSIQEVAPTTFLGIWEIQETPDYFLQRLTLGAAEQKMFDSFIHLKRRLHWLSYRFLLQEICGKTNIEIVYNPNGKPLLHNISGHISVSHSGNMAAVLFSEGKNIGLDIEIISSRIEALASKFVSEKEMAFLSTQNNLSIPLHIIWGAKEAIYKACDIPELIFAEDINLSPFQARDKGIIEAQLLSRTTYHLHYQIIQDYMLVYTANPEI